MRCGEPLARDDARQAQTLLGLTDDEAQRGDINRLAEARGDAALGHRDAGAGRPGQGGRAHGAGTPPSGGPIQVSRRPRHGPGRQRTGTGRWRAPFSRSSRRSPRRDEWVHRWYRAAAARMRRDSLLASSEPLLGRARQLFPKDAAFPFYAGCLHETQASPADPGGVRGDRAVPAQRNRVHGSRVPIGTRRPGSFTEALALQPAWPEARLRLGRVLGLLGRHKEAAAALRRALDETDDPPLVYWGSLFLGAEEQSLGRDAEARASFERARALRPGAQAPRLALSQLARRAGDRSQALAELRAVLTLPSDEVSRYDPLWDYYISRGSEADILFAELRRQLGTGGAPDAGVVR